MLKKLTKTGIAAGMHLTGMDRLMGARRGVRKHPFVLGYHRVVENFDEAAVHSIPAMLVSTQTLERQLDWFGRRYDFVSLDELGDILEGRRTTRKPPVALTFDDGYADFYHHAYPLLKRKGIPSAVFVVTSLLGSTRLQLHDELYLLVSGALSQSFSERRRPLRELIQRLDLPDSVNRRLCAVASDSTDSYRMTRAFLELLPPTRMDQLMRLLREWIYVPEERLHEFHSLDWDMLQEMLPQDVTIGSHTLSHALLAHEGWDRVVAEVGDSRRLLQQRLGDPIHHFAYPDGRFNAPAVRAVSQAGYRCAYTICTHQDPRFPMLTIPRRVLWEKTCMDSFGRFSPAILSCQVNGIFDPAAKCRQMHWA